MNTPTVLLLLFQRQDVSCSGIRRPAPARLEGEVLWLTACLRAVCPDIAWAGVELLGLPSWLDQGKAAGQSRNG